MIEFQASCQLPTKFGTFTMHGFSDSDENKEHIALTFGDWEEDEAVLTRVHSECLTGDALFSQRCDCGPQLQKALRDISTNGSGCILYLRQEGRGIGLINKIKAYKLQEEGKDTVEANQHLGFDDDLRSYDMCKIILDHLNISKIKLMTNNPKKVEELKAIGINVERLPIYAGHNDNNRRYLETKKHKMGHFLP